MLVSMSTALADVNYINRDITNNLMPVTWTEHTTINAGVNVTIKDLYVDDVIEIENLGTLNATMYVNAGNSVFLRNRGEMNVVYEIADTAKVTQLVGGMSELRDAGDGDFDIVVQNASDMSLIDTLNFAKGHNLTIENSSFVYSGGGTTLAESVRFVGKNTIYVKNLDTLTDTPILRGVDGADKVTLEGDLDDPMFALVTSVRGNDLYASLVRETDYVKIFGTDDVGLFLNELRVDNPNDKLLRLLDVATNRNDLNSVLMRSERMNPIKMMRPVRTLEMLDMHTMFDTELSGGGVRMVSDDDADIYGANLRLAGAVTDSFSVGVTVFAGRMDYSSDTFDASADVVSGAIDAMYKDAAVMLRGRVGGALTLFHVGKVWDNGEVENNPMGMSYFAAADGGVPFYITGGFSVTPLVGVMYDNVRIMNSSDNNFMVNTGAEFGFETSGYDINYEYFGRIRVTSMGDVMATLRIGALSENDSFRAGLEFTRVCGDMSSYEVKINAGFSF